MRDSEGNIIKCKCGNPAGSGIIRKESYMAWCSDCSPYKDEPEAKLVYNPPYYDEFAKIPEKLQEFCKIRLKNGFLACSTPEDNDPL